MTSTEILERFENLPFPVELELGTLTATIGDIFNLQEGKILKTDQPAGMPFKFRIGGVEMGTAEVLVFEKSVSCRVNVLIEIKKTAPEGNGNS